MRYNRR